MSSAGNGLTTQLPTRESNSWSRNSVWHSFRLFNRYLGLPSDIVPATYKKKRATTAPKVAGDEGDEKPGRPTEEGSRPTGLGRGQRWAH